MKLVTLDARLKDIASLVDKCNVVADVGTDHGYLPIYLVQKEIATKAYATDIAISPLNIAKENIKLYELMDKIDTILCPGLSEVPLVDTIIIAGMGGNMIIDILKENKNNHSTYILQANNNINTLRRYLSENGFKIIDEKVSFAHKKYYEIMKVIPQHQVLNELEIEYGPINLKNKTLLFKNKWQEIIDRFTIILDDFQGSNDEFIRLTNKLNEMKNIIKESE